VVDYGIGKFKKARSYTFNLKLEAVQFAESWCFVYAFVYEPGSSDRRRVSNTSQQSDSIVLIEAGGFC